MQKGHHIEYEVSGKKIVLAQGMDNAICELRESPVKAGMLKKKLVEFFNGKESSWLANFINDHDRARFADDAAFNESHKAKYKNSVADNALPLPQHKIPSYILKEIEKRLSRK